MTNYSTQTGFSLVETLVAITILLVIIIGPMTIATKASQSTTYSNQQAVAFFLAQEGAELAQKARDDILLLDFDAGNTTSGDAWAAFIDDSGGAYEDCLTGGCGLEINTDSTGSIDVLDCSGSLANCQLYYDDSTSVRARYTHDDDSGANPETPYIRVIELSDNGTQDVEVVSRVTWRSSDSRLERSVEVRTYLYNVYDR